MGEVLVVLFVALLVFGGKLPDAARKLGSALSEFKRGMNEEMRRLDDGLRSSPPPAPEWKPEKTEPQEGAATETNPPGSSNP